MRQLEYCLPVAFALLLAACGGGGDGAGSVQSAGAGGPGIAVGEPAPSGLVREEFIKLARGGACNDIRNRLFVIDGKQVFWDVQGNCADAAYGRNLYGRTTAELQCTSHDSIAGPQTSCADPAQRELFDTILKNLDQADLGLGGAHKVEPIDFLPKDAVLATQPLLSDRHSGITSELTVAVRDADSFAKLWASNYQGAGNPPAVPKIDFARQMVIGVFIGSRPNGCYDVTIDKVEVRTGKISVEYTEKNFNGPAVLCTGEITNPAQMVLLDAIEGDVAFIKH